MVGGREGAPGAEAPGVGVNVFVGLKPHASTLKCEAPRFHRKDSGSRGCPFFCTGATTAATEILASPE